MPEQLDLTAPIVPPSRTFYRITLITFDVGNAILRIELTGSDNTVIYCEYRDAPAMTFMRTLATADFTVISMPKRIFNRLVADGKLPAGTVSGTP